ncbi:hypothetical protein ASD54_11060 [Rhizobium sp. Root149]|uniref:hypothetical protein n=1 Tax=Rhizobium sp. Root149 TaxID=1736473 RepID=UPI0007162ECB|nr:hypothetical protein [Rhizobium sp. Root149]KQZ50738.1 hypothetical protein ASD54_11060 [Rhizobium sp. Root149]
MILDQATIAIRVLTAFIEYRKAKVASLTIYELSATTRISKLQLQPVLSALVTAKLLGFTKNPRSEQTRYQLAGGA